MEIELHNTPQFYVGYLQNWITKLEKDKAPEVQIVVAKDLLTLVTIAAGNLAPQPVEKSEPLN